MEPRGRAHCIVAALLIVTLPAAFAWPERAIAGSRRWVADQLLVRPKALARSVAHSAIAAEGAVTEREIPALGVRVVRTPPGRRLVAERSLRASGAFRFVERNYIATLDSLPNDPLYVEQWGLPVVRVPAAWDATRGTGVTIAVLDTGVDPGHVDLAARLVAGFNALNGTTWTADDHGHGTRMAGVAGAAGFNGIGVIGVAPDAQLMPVKVMSASGHGTYADIAAGIVFAADHGARVINLSLGGSVASSTLSAAVTYAVDRGAVVVAAAGNFGFEVPSYPAAYADAVAVGATDEQDRRAIFSNYGTWLDMVAPGVNILTTNWGGGYAPSTGTSPATPFVAGAAALVLSVNPSLQPRQVASLLALTNDDLGVPGFDSVSGWGRLNVERAVAQAQALAAIPDAGAPAARLLAPEADAVLEGVTALGVDATDDVGVVRVEYSVDGVVVASAGDAPFSAAWDPQFTIPGAHVLGATAYDALGNRGAATPIVVTVAGTEVNCSMTGGACLPGGGSPETDCFAEWFVAGAERAASVGRRAPRITCVDGAPCDRDGIRDGACRFDVAVCFGVSDSRLVTKKGSPACDASQLAQFNLLKPAIQRGGNPLDTAAAVAMLAGVSALGAAESDGTCVAGVKRLGCHSDADCDSALGAGDGLCGLRATSLAGIVGGSERCTALQSVTVPLRQRNSHFRPATRKFKIATSGPASGRRRVPKDVDTLRLVCQPAD